MRAIMGMLSWVRGAETGKRRPDAAVDDPAPRTPRAPANDRRDTWSGWQTSITGLALLRTLLYPQEG